MQFNGDKLEMIRSGSKTNLGRLAAVSQSLCIGGTVVKPSSGIRDLGVLFDNDLGMRSHVSKISATVPASFLRAPTMQTVSHNIHRPSQAAARRPDPLAS